MSHANIAILNDLGGSTAMRCPKCGSQNVAISTHQENRGSVTTTKTTSLYKQKGHGVIWWLLIGWWWWIIDLFLWIFLFIPRLLIKIFHRKKYIGKSSSVSATVNNIAYVTLYTCHDCGHTWKRENH